METVVALLSGGMDSTVLVAKLKAENYAVLPVTVDYGQRHRSEILHAALIADHYNLPEITVLNLRDVASVAMGGSSQTDNSIPVPHGHYAADNMKTTVVPNRNMVMLACATALALSRKATRVGFAVHAGDHPIYADCRPEFVDAMNGAIMAASESKVTLWAPFIGMTKTSIARLGGSLDVPFHLTWSCYEGGKVHCGKCGTCVERIEAFRDAGIDDPTIYEGRA